MLSTTPDKKNSYLNKFKKKRVQTTDKENKYEFHYTGRTI